MNRSVGEKLDGCPLILTLLLLCPLSLAHPPSLLPLSHTHSQVCDVAHTGFPEHVRNGFTFKDSTHAAVEVTLGRAFKSYNEGFDWWQGTLVPRAMCQDWSWSRSAQDYLSLYREIVPV
jgi:starch synthase